MARLENLGELRRVHTPVSTRLELTALADLTLRAQGPALLIEQAKGYKWPVLINLFGSPKRVALAMGVDDVMGLRGVGEVLATLKEPEPPGA